MSKKNVIVYVSSRNNYDMLENEVLKNIKLEGFEFINVDDKSSQTEIEKGKKLCDTHNITFLENKGRGVQHATQTLVDFINGHRPDCRWVICFQHDIYPISPGFFQRISDLQETGKLDEFGLLGFNVLDHGNYTANAAHEYAQGEKPLGMIGMAHLGIHNKVTRWLCPVRQPELINSGKFNKPFIVEFPMWAAVGISIDKWNRYVKPTDEYHFHLWLPDVAMQLNYQNYPSLILPDLYCMNDQMKKELYGIHRNSAAGSMNGNDYHFGEYSNFRAWKGRWGWDYESVQGSFQAVKLNYKDTLIGKYFDHDYSSGPLRSYDSI